MDKDQVRNYVIENLQIIKKEIADKTYPFQVMKVNLDGSAHPEPMLPLSSIELIGSSAVKSLKDKELLIRFLYGYISKTISLDYNEDSFNDLFEELAYFEREGKYLFRTIGFISALQLDKNIEIEPGLSLLLPSNEYLNFFYNVWYAPKPGLLDGMGMSYLMLLQSGLYFENRQYAETRETLIPIRPKIEKLTQALLLNTSLTKSCYVSTVYTFSYLFNYGRPVELNYFDPNKLMALESSPIEEDALKNLYTDLLKHNNGPIYVSLRRVNYLRNKRSLEDKFLDLMIILEGLFPKIQQELKFRLSICVGALLRSREVCDQVRVMYDIRSAIAHGSEVPEKKKFGDFETALSLLDGIVRKSILKCIDFTKDGAKLDGLEDHLLKPLFNNSIPIC